LCEVLQKVISEEKVVFHDDQLVVLSFYKTERKLVSRFYGTSLALPLLTSSREYTIEYVVQRIFVVGRDVGHGWYEWTRASVRVDQVVNRILFEQFVDSSLVTVLHIVSDVSKNLTLIVFSKL